jgi:uncharacterized membrane-anchored protein
VQVAREQLDAWSDGVQKGLAARKGREHQFYDVHFHDFMRDPLGTVRSIYDKFGVAYSDRAHTALSAWRNANPPERHGKHAYDKDEFGIRREEIHERFSEYMGTLGIARERNRETVA